MCHFSSTVITWKECKMIYVVKHGIISCSVKLKRWSLTERDLSGRHAFCDSAADSFIGGHSCSELEPTARGRQHTSDLRHCYVKNEISRLLQLPVNVFAPSLFFPMWTKLHVADWWSWWILGKTESSSWLFTYSSLSIGGRLHKV
jgi:hypothetical protein